MPMPMLALHGSYFPLLMRVHHIPTTVCACLQIDDSRHWWHSLIEGGACPTGFGGLVPLENHTYSSSALMCGP